MKIVTISDYSLERIYNNWKKGLSPSHELWGLAELKKQKDIEVDVLPFESNRSINLIGNLLKIHQLDQQLSLIKNHKKYDLIVETTAGASTKLILFLKLFGFIKTPLVGFVHWPLLGNKSNNKFIQWIGKKLILQFDRLIYPSQEILKHNIQVFDLKKEEYEKRFVNINWGSETSFFEPHLIQESDEQEPFAVSIGKTKRDFDTLIEAFKEIDLKLKLYPGEGFVSSVKNIPPNVEIITTRHTYKDFIDIYRKSSLILISIQKPFLSTIGLTSLLDAISVGRPVVMTENKYIDIDVEKLGIGFKVGVSDVKGWVEKINILLEDPSLSKKMGEKALTMQRELYNMDKFSETYIGILKDMISEGKPS
jgi:glycosyltransferase involved in cell wall biosynthesis